MLASCLWYALYHDQLERGVHDVEVGAKRKHVQRETAYTQIFARVLGEARHIGSARDLVARRHRRSQLSFNAEHVPTTTRRSG